MLLEPLQLVPRRLKVKALIIDVCKPLIFGRRPECNQTKKGSKNNADRTRDASGIGAPNENGFGNQNEDSDDSQKSSMATLGRRAKRMRMNMMM